MASIFDAAKYILERKGEMTTWKLQKLCYYAQAWSLAWDESPLFDEDFEAWRNGPVCPELFRYHQGKFVVGPDNFKVGDSRVFNDNQRETLDIVLRDYGDDDPSTLRELTHNELPWREARGGLSIEENCHTVITKERMGEYYGSL
ncbi:MAG: DUF4065 domain-containing protein [Oscillospiraceae bacterium]|nr:DUF4065 domain-containing protein [Oscillospiraceae bacterium]